MKTSIQTKIALVVIIAGLAFSCKKTEPVAPTTYDVDSTATMTDSTATTVDSATIDTTATAVPAN